MKKTYDVVIVGGGPAGLSAALALGRGRKKTLLSDAGAPRNVTAEEVHNFLTRDGTPPAEMRRLGRAELARYDVDVRSDWVAAIEGERGRFQVTLAHETVFARRVLLAVGMVDVLPDTPGYGELWGKAIFQCPYCHGWEVRDRPFGNIVPSADLLEWSILLKGWSRDLIAFTDGAFAVPAEARERLEAAQIPIEERRIRRLVANGSSLEAVELEDGARVARSVLFARPPQVVPEIARSLGLELDPHGFVRVNDACETSRPGVYAAGDIASMPQGGQAAILSAAAGMKAAARLNHELSLDLARP